MYDGLGISGRDLHRGVYSAGGRAADQERHGETLTLHFLRHVRHLIERRRDEPAQADHVGADFARRFQNFVARHHHAQVDDFIIVAAQHHADDILADVVDVAFHRGHHDATRGLPSAAILLFRLHKWKQICHRFLHHPRALHHLRQKHLAGAKEFAHHAHAVHQRAFDHAQGLAQYFCRASSVSASM